MAGKVYAVWIVERTYVNTHLPGNEFSHMYKQYMHGAKKKKIHFHDDDDDCEKERERGPQLQLRVSNFCHTRCKRTKIYAAALEKAREKSNASRKFIGIEITLRSMHIIVAVHKS
jgi:hypothetical protein